MNTKLMSAAALGLLVAACGTDPRERVTGGAAAGAATGAGVGALGGPVGVLAGAAIGGGAGAVTGAVTEPRDVNLGRPVWDNPETRVPGVTNDRGGSGAGSASTRQAQQALAARGYNPGPADGMWGERSRRAMMDFQRANNLPATGSLNTSSMQALNMGGGGAMTGTGSPQQPAFGGGGAGSAAQGTAPPLADDRSGRNVPGTGGVGNPNERGEGFGNRGSN
jgi:peptidoglycan hydrolase-like protein with peptidoglycan-binding domain